MRNFLFFLVIPFLAFAKAELTVAPEQALVDQEVEIQVSGLAPSETIQIKALVFDREGTEWSSLATFSADSQGAISLSKAPSLGGSYEGLDPMGLFWSLQSESKSQKTFKAQEDTYSVYFEVLDKKGEILASKEARRSLKSPEVVVTPIRSDGVVGTLFAPKSETPLPVIILLSGSEGGISETKAKVLASNGFAVMALGYFRMDSLPQTLEKIPFEYFENAFDWLERQPQIDAKRMGIFGSSRGGELTLLLASHYPEKFSAVTAAVPSSVTFSALRKNTVPAWTQGGAPLRTFSSFPSVALWKLHGFFRNRPLATSENFLQLLKKVSPDAFIPVEKITAPLLLISAGDDQMWPSAFFAKQIEERLVQKGAKTTWTHLMYPKAGHQICIPHLPALNTVSYLSTLHLWFNNGGSAQENAHANQDSWKKMVAFFHETLR